MIDRSIKWWGHYAASKIRYEFQAIQTTEHGRSAIYTTFELVPLDTETLVTAREPTLSLEPEEAQSLFNALWDSGLRPQDGQGGMAHTTAQAAHIADLRAIALKKCGIEP